MGETHQHVRTMMPPTALSAAVTLCFVSLALAQPRGTDAEWRNRRLVGPPPVGANELRILSPTELELELITTKSTNTPPRTHWDWIEDRSSFQATPEAAFAVSISGKPVKVRAVGCRRRPLYAPLARDDLRVGNYLYLRLAQPVSKNETVEVQNPNERLWPRTMRFAATASPLRYSPAIHVNQEGYAPAFPKRAMIGYYLGELGELKVDSAAGFQLVDSHTGRPVFQGPLTARRDAGYVYSPAPCQKVLQADFSSFTTPGEYRLVVPGLGASLPFLIDDGIAMAFARAYALGLYHQRCGASNAPPFTRFVHDACHLAPAQVPLPQTDFAFTWNTIAGKSADYTNNVRHTAPQLKDPASQLYPFVNRGSVEVRGGHHDAGDYSKYTINSASLIHYLVFAVDAFPGVAELDNLGLPESGDRISDLLQEAKWEADYLAKLQDSDGGFYFLVYPRQREYESNVLPDHGDPQVVWPKNTAATAAAVAALAQCGSSPRFKAAFPNAAVAYLQKAQLGWNFLTNAIARHGKDGAYQKLTHYGDNFMHDDELAWAACELFLATGDPAFQRKLFAWFPNPRDRGTFRWGWWRMVESYGNAVRSYAFGARSGRLAAKQLDAHFLAQCEAEVLTAADDQAVRARYSAYGTSFPLETKRVRGAGWYFSSVQAFDITAGYQLDPRPEFLDAILSNLNYEAGGNPVNVCYVTGLGWKRQREIVHQYAQNDWRALPPSGIPLGNIQAGFGWLALYGGTLKALTFPADDAGRGPYPFYDRWADTFNVSTEFVVVDQARSLASLAYLAALTPVKTQTWRSATARIVGLPREISINVSVTAALQTPGLDLTRARIVWEARDQEPAYGLNYTFRPMTFGNQWVEVDVQWPDGRRVVGAASFLATNGLPTISVVATHPIAAEAGRNPAVFTFTRTGNATGSLTVNFQLSGTATKWNDYRRREGDMPESVTFPARATSAKLTIYAVDDTEVEGTETVILTLRPDRAYNIGAPASATATIKDNDIAVPSATLAK